MMSRLLGENLEKSYFIVLIISICRFGPKICNHEISKTITARSLKLGKEIEDDKYIKW